MSSSLRFAIGSLLILGFGCSDADIKSNLNPDGDAEVLQLFGKRRNMESMAVESALAFGFHDDWKGSFGLTNAVAGGTQKFRLVVDELLDGETLEQFACSCTLGNKLLNNMGNVEREPGNCQGNPEYSIQPDGCAENPDTATLDAGRWADDNIDGVPDVSRMQPGVVTIDCGAAGSWTNDIAEGWYNPSGNQFPGAGNAGTLFDYLGPAIVVQPPSLPTSATCTFQVASSVVSKDGDPIVLPTGEAGLDADGAPVMYADALSFTTESLALLVAEPPSGATGVEITTAPLVTMNVALDAATVDGTSVTLEVTAGGDVAGTVSYVEEDQTIEFNPAADLLPDTAYTLTVTTAVTDSFGAALPAPVVVTFTTLAAN